MKIYSTWEINMQSQHRSLPEMMIFGVSVRTQYSREMQAETALIGKTIQKFFESGFLEQLQDLKAEDYFISAYTDYESDWQGEYTYFFGVPVQATAAQCPAGLEVLKIPAQKYCVLTSEEGQMPNVVIESWQKIWAMTAKDFGAQRAYRADFEIYDERSLDPQNTVVDFYIGLTSES